MIDYSNPTKLKGIERENMRIYKNLINIYTRKPNINFLTDEHKHQQSEYQKSKCATRFNHLKSIQDENLRLFISLLKIKPTKSLTIEETDKHWQNFLIFKSRKFLNKNARIVASY